MHNNVECIKFMSNVLAVLFHTTAKESFCKTVLLKNLRFTAENVLICKL